MSAKYSEHFDFERESVFSKLSHFSSDFVLGGGTAIMLQLSHRKSFDFDCFSDKPLEKKLLRETRLVFGDNMRVEIDNSDLLLFTTPSQVKVDFMYFPYAPVEKIIKTQPISMFSLIDLAANKAYAIGRRATWRDYVDFFFLLQQFSLEKIIKTSQKKFKGEFSEKLFLEQLVYHKDLDMLPVEFLKKTYSNTEIKGGLENQAIKYTGRKLSLSGSF